MTRFNLYAPKHDVVQVIEQIPQQTARYQSYSRPFQQPTSLLSTQQLEPSTQQEDDVSLDEFGPSHSSITAYGILTGAQIVSC